MPSQNAQVLFWAICDVLYRAGPSLIFLQQQDSRQTLFYLDPPDVHHTRSTTDAYQYEMDESDHVGLLQTVQNRQGRVVLSGYPNQLYDQILRDWNRHDRQVDNKVSSLNTKRIMTESLWCNL